MLRANLNTVLAAAHEATQDVMAVMSPQSGRDLRHAGLLVAALVCAILPLEISHLMSAIVGVLAYLLMQALQPRVQRSSASSKVASRKEHVNSKWHPVHDGRHAGVPRSGSTGGTPRHYAPSQLEEVAPEVPKQEVRKPSAMPVAAPTFKASGWEEEVQELLIQIAPNPEAEAAVAEIARAVRRAIFPILPEAEVTGFANGNLLGRAAFGVAVPEVDIVISVSPTALMGRLQGRWAQGRGPSLKIDARKLQKSAIRACTDRLVSTSAFKFRRSAFRGQEPKVTMLAPSPAAQGQGVPVNLSVNSVTPLYNAALIAECGQLEPRAKELILLVKRWAKDRGLCHEAKGHLSPYAWTLLAIFFMQAGAKEPSLPPLDCFPTSSGLMKRGPSEKRAEAPRLAACQRSAAALFQEFIAFYAREFNWQKEVVSVRVGRRGPPDVSVPLHIILTERGRTTVGPSIEDPFEDSQNIGECMTAVSLMHMQEELRRADEICSQPCTSLTALLEPWAPPEQED